MSSLKNNNIVLIGFMGCGKTTLGKKLAKDLNMNFVDMDEEIELQERKSISAIFEEKGEEGFRILETNYLKELEGKKGLIVSTGGGAPCFNNNMKLINSIGKSVYIKLTPEELVKRLLNEQQKRPLVANLNKEELLSFIEQKLDVRKMSYELADHVYYPNEKPSTIYR
jgi:shikimate kinase